MREYHLVDKSEWGPGMWATEPDYIAYIDAETTYPMVAKRNLVGVFVGFVGIDERHPLYMQPLSSEEFDFIDVHNGAPTFAAFLPDESVNFSPPKKLWWVGFDCMHDTDFCPYKTATGRPRRRSKKEEYRDLNYVKEQLEFLASQLATFDTRFF